MKYFEYAFATAVVLIALFCAVLLGDQTYEKLFGGYSYYTVQVDDNLPPFKVLEDRFNDETKESSLIRLHEDGGDNRFFCSGFVVSDIYAITAAHCLVDHKQHKKTADIIIHTMIQGEYTVKAKAVAINISSDLGIIKGDFSKFNKLRVDPRPQSLLHIQLPLAACGFPYGDTDLCTPFVPHGNFYNMLGGSGYLFPGMLGGPVIDVTRQMAIGVNRGALSNGIVIAPIIGIFNDARIKWEL